MNLTQMSSLINWKEGQFVHASRSLVMLKLWTGIKRSVKKSFHIFKVQWFEMTYRLSFQPAKLKIICYQFCNDGRLVRCLMFQQSICHQNDVLISVFVKQGKSAKRTKEILKQIIKCFLNIYYWSRDS